MKSIDEQKRYLSDLLELDPAKNAIEILQRRLIYSGTISRTDRTDRMCSVEARLELMQLLEYCRLNFWDTLDNDVESILASNRFENALELTGAASRLLGWYRQRENIVKLKNLLGNSSLADEVYRLAPLSARDADTRKEQVIRAMQRGKHRRYRKDAEHIQQNFSEIYAIEQDWFDEIRLCNPTIFPFGMTNPRPVFPSKQLSVPNPAARIPGWVYVIIVLVLIRVLFLAMTRR